jgi:predicted CDP-diglyceride synthetase/phosphatidate cytidylyltransferase
VGQQDILQHMFAMFASYYPMHPNVFAWKLVVIHCYCMYLLATLLCGLPFQLYISIVELKESCSLLANVMQKIEKLCVAKRNNEIPFLSLLLILEFYFTRPPVDDIVARGLPLELHT